MSSRRSVGRRKRSRFGSTTSHPDERSSIKSGEGLKIDDCSIGDEVQVRVLDADTAILAYKVHEELTGGR
jgi:hypothetical protein